MEQFKAGQQQAYEELLAIVQDEYTRVCQREKEWENVSRRH